MVSKVWSLNGPKIIQNCFLFVPLLIFSLLNHMTVVILIITFLQVSTSLGNSVPAERYLWYSLRQVYLRHCLAQ